MHTHARGPRCRKSSRLTLQACLALAGTLAAGSALAANGPGIVYGPAGAGAGVAAIPSLGGVAMMLLGAFMLFVFWRMHRNGNFPGGRFMAIALVSGAIASGMGGAKLVSDAVADSHSPFWDREFDDPTGGFVPLVLNQDEEFDWGGIPPEFYFCVRNTSGVPVRIDVMQEAVGDDRCLLVNPTSAGPDAIVAQGASAPELPECSAGLVIEPGQGCGAKAGNAGNASDLRLKTDIVQVGVAANGLPLYEFRYLDGATRYRGVMAQDVLQHTPAAVRMRADGYMAVDYGMLGLEMQPVR
ncbi:midcut-by-XrtH protein [Pseudazoarcus pumilus]|nr:midcut-by-XrtH protein [Pseudazoarcus pumilus]